MNKLDKKETSNTILEAIRAKRDNRTSNADEIARIEESLIADIEAFDLDAAERNARRDNITHSATGKANPGISFPKILPAGEAFHQKKKSATQAASNATSVNAQPATSLLDQLRQQASSRQREINSAAIERTVINEAIDNALQQLFSFLHELVQQLNIVKPEIPRRYLLIDRHEIGEMNWQDGFADYRTQPQSAGAMVELVTFTYQLSAPEIISIGRDALVVERFRTLLFDYGLQSSCKEIRNERRYIERAEFSVKSQLSVSARWRADFSQGRIILETRNLERLGNINYIVRPEQIDQGFLDEFGRMVLGHPNRFRDLVQRLI